MVRPIVAIAVCAAPAILGFLILHACAHSPPVTGLDQLRQECIDSGGIFHVIYGDYPTGWIADNAQCWYGAQLEDVERIQSLGAD